MKLLVRLLLAGGMLVAAVSALSAGAGAGQADGSDEAARSVQDGVFTETQAERGSKLYEMNCLACHQPDEFAEGYMESWSGQTVGDLFEFVRMSMPEDSPGRLARTEYADILAYIFSMNDLPPGESDLESDSDALSKVIIKGRDGSN